MKTGWLVIDKNIVSKEILQLINKEVHYEFMDYIMWYGVYANDLMNTFINDTQYDIMYDIIDNILYFVDVIDDESLLLDHENRVYATPKLLKPLQNIANAIRDKMSILPISQLPKEELEDRKSRVDDRKEILKSAILDMRNTDGKVIVYLPYQYKYKVYDTSNGKLKGIAKFIGFEHAESFGLKKGIQYHIDIGSDGMVTATPVTELEIVTG